MAFGFGRILVGSRFLDMTVLVLCWAEDEFLGLAIIVFLYAFFFIPLDSLLLASRLNVLLHMIISKRPSHLSDSTMHISCSIEQARCRDFLSNRQPLFQESQPHRPHRKCRRNNNASQPLPHAISLPSHLTPSQPPPPPHSLVPIHKHTPPLVPPTPLLLTPHRRRRPLSPRKLHFLLPKTPRLQPNSPDPHLPRLLQNLPRHRRRRNDAETRVFRIGEVGRGGQGWM